MFNYKFSCSTPSVNKQQANYAGFASTISPSCRAAANSTAAWGTSSECGWTSSRGSASEASTLPLRAESAAKACSLSSRLEQISWSRLIRFSDAKDSPVHTQKHPTGAGIKSERNGGSTSPRYPVTFGSSEPEPPRPVSPLQTRLCIRPLPPDS